MTGELELLSKRRREGFDWFVVTVTIDLSFSPLSIMHPPYSSQASCCSFSGFVTSGFRIGWDELIARVAQVDWHHVPDPGNGRFGHTGRAAFEKMSAPFLHHWQLSRPRRNTWKTRRQVRFYWKKKKKIKSNIYIITLVVSVIGTGMMTHMHATSHTHNVGLLIFRLLHH